MPFLDGNEVALNFRENFPQSMLVFCSGVYQPSVDSFKPAPFRYLLKEFSSSRMLLELSAITDKLLSEKRAPYIVCTSHSKTFKLLPEEIYYISLKKRGSTVHLYPHIRKKNYSLEMACSKKLPELYETLKDWGFGYPHISYLVNFKYIKYNSDHEFSFIEGGEMLTIARARKDDFLKSYALFLSQKY